MDSAEKKHKAAAEESQAPTSKKFLQKTEAGKICNILCFIGGGGEEGEG